MGLNNLFKVTRRQGAGSGSTKICRLLGHAGFGVSASKGLQQVIRREVAPLLRDRAGARPEDTAHAPLTDGNREGAGTRPAGAGKMAAAAAAANGTGGSSGMEVDAAGNRSPGSGLWRWPSRCIKAAFLNPGSGQEGGRQHCSLG